MSKGPISYNDYLKKQFADSGVEDLTGGMKPGVVESGENFEHELPQNDWMKNSSPTDYSKSALAAGNSLSQGGGAADAASSALMMSGNPYAMAGGLALKTLSSMNDAKNERNMQAYQAEIERIKNMQEGLTNLAAIGKGLQA